MLRRWLRFETCGIPWEAFLADARSVPEFEDASLEGLTDRVRCRIYVRAELAARRERAEEVLLHEIEHAIGASSGALSSVYGGSDAREERAILAYNGPRFAALKSAGILRFPPPPRTGGAPRRSTT